MSNIDTTMLKTCQVSATVMDVLIIEVLFQQVNQSLVCFYFFLCTNVYLDPTGCDITLTVNESIQYVATEGYPDRYQNNQNCRFNFVAPPGRKFNVMFEDFDLQLFRDFLHFRK